MEAGVSSLDRSTSESNRDERRRKEGVRSEIVKEGAKKREGATGGGKKGKGDR